MVGQHFVGEPANDVQQFGHLLCIEVLILIEDAPNELDTLRAPGAFLNVVEDRSTRSPEGTFENLRHLVFPFPSCFTIPLCQLIPPATEARRHACTGPSSRRSGPRS